METKTALLVGATGLVGGHLLNLLLADDTYKEVKSFVRRPTGKVHPKLKEIVTDFSRLETVENEFHGDDFFCCVGTTIRKAGSQEAFEKVDYAIPVHTAELAAKQGVNHYLIISSLGADATSGNFYLRTKGKMEEKLKSIGFRNLSILRPSLLTGDREEFRVGESIGKYAMKALDPLLIGGWRKYRSIAARDVAKAMLRIAKEKSGTDVYQSDRLQLFAEK